MKEETIATALLFGKVATLVEGGRYVCEREERRKGEKERCSQKNISCGVSEDDSDYDGLFVPGNVLRNLYEGVRFFLCLSALYEYGDIRRFFRVCGGYDATGELCPVTDLSYGADDSGKTFVLRNCVA